MHLVYATGQENLKLFGIVSSLASVPSDATVCAICHGGRSIRNLDDAVLYSLTDQEFMRLARMIKTAIEMEQDPSRNGLNSAIRVRENAWAVRASQLKGNRFAVRGLDKVHRRRLRNRHGNTLGNPMALAPLSSGRQEGETLLLAS